MLVSVVIPCYRGSAFLAKSIESCLRQSLKDIEVIVVDDGSPDDCLEIAKRFADRDSRVKVLRHGANRGVSAAFNTGFNAAKGEYMTRLAQDDVFADNALLDMASYLDGRPALGFVWCDMQYLDCAGNSKGVWRTADESANCLYQKLPIGLCFMWRRAVWESVGGFDSTFDAAEDHEFCLRVAKKFGMGKVPHIAPLFVRRHEQMGSQVFAGKQELAVARAYRKHSRQLSGALPLIIDAYVNAAWRFRGDGHTRDALAALAAAISLAPTKASIWRHLFGTCAAGVIVCFRDGIQCLASGERRRS